MNENFSKSIKKYSNVLAMMSPLLHSDETLNQTCKEVGIIQFYWFILNDGGWGYPYNPRSISARLKMMKHLFFVRKIRGR